MNNEYELETQDELFVVENCVKAYLPTEDEHFVVENCVKAYLA
ncbi:hypothetical protein ACFZDJ_34765 [Streptomyces sp. NPDC007896]